MFRINVKKRARILTRAEFKRVLKVCTITREAIRNQLVLCLSHALGLRVTELALITIRDVMHPSGNIRAELTMRSEITKNSRVRNLPLSSDLLLHHLELYLVPHRARHRRAAGQDGRVSRTVAGSASHFLEPWRAVRAFDQETSLGDRGG